MADEATTDDASNGRYHANEISIDEADAVVVDHDHAKVVSALLGDQLAVYSDDEYTESKCEHNLIVNGQIATQVGAHIYNSMVVIDARDKKINWLLDNDEPLNHAEV